MLALARGVGVYHMGSIDSRNVLFSRAARSTAAFAGLFLLLQYAVGLAHERIWFVLAASAVFGVMVARDALLRVLVANSRLRPRFVTRIALLGDADSIRDFDSVEDATNHAVVEREYLETQNDIRLALRKADRLVDLLQQGQIDRVVVLAPGPGIPGVNAVIRRFGMRGVPVDLLTGATQVSEARQEIGRVRGYSTVHIRPGLHGFRRRATKRAFDIAMSAAFLILFAPVFAVVAVAIKLGSSGPVFYRQGRLGQHGRQFDMVKFRSMVPNADELVADLSRENEADGPLFKMKLDPRVTRVGRFIRRTSIDELPQLWNVLRGQMSLVGPRPALPSEADGWPVELFDRLEVLPGISGLWQVCGRSNASFADYARLDLYYVDNWTFRLDLAILARTIPAAAGRGAY